MSFVESTFAGVVGLSSQRMRDLRKKLLTPGVDYEKAAGRVLLTDTGVEKIRAALTLPEEKNAATVNGFTVTLRVWNARLVNRHIILAYHPDADPTQGGGLLRVRVRDSKNFSRFTRDGQPMELEARHLQADLYEATKCPRAKGRW
jgi:hypothetical protein